MELMAKFVSNLALSIIAAASAIVGIALSKIATIADGVIAVFVSFKMPTKIKGASSILHTITTAVLL